MADPGQPRRREFGTIVGHTGDASFRSAQSSILSRPKHSDDRIEGCFDAWRHERGTHPAGGKALYHAGWPRKREER